MPADPGIQLETRHQHDVDAKQSHCTKSWARRTFFGPDLRQHDNSLYANVGFNLAGFRRRFDWCHNLARVLWTPRCFYYELLGCYVLHTVGTGASVWYHFGPQGRTVPSDSPLRRCMCPAFLRCQLPVLLDSLLNLCREDFMDQLAEDVGACAAEALALSDFDDGFEAPHVMDGSSQSWAQRTFFGPDLRQHDNSLYANVGFNLAGLRRRFDWCHNLARVLWTPRCFYYELLGCYVLHTVGTGASVWYHFGPQGRTVPSDSPLRRCMCPAFLRCQLPVLLDFLLNLCREDFMDQLAEDVVACAAEALALSDFDDGFEDAGFCFGRQRREAHNFVVFVLYWWRRLCLRQQLVRLLSAGTPFSGGGDGRLLPGPRSPLLGRNYSFKLFLGYSCCRCTCCSSSASCGVSTQLCIPWPVPWLPTCVDFVTVAGGHFDLLAFAGVVDALQAGGFTHLHLEAEGIRLRKLGGYPEAAKP
ncbi:FHY [Symbiodinium sp. KB8]|nr:FHY [Symbiodinium sp. KB8]